MRALLVVLLMLVTLHTLQAQQFSPSIKLGYGFSFLPTGEPNFNSTTYGGGKMHIIDIEYTYLHDNHSYYNSTLIGFTTGIKHLKTRNKLINIYLSKESQEEVKSLAIPILLTLKATEWNDVFRIGLVGIYDYDRKIDNGFVWSPRPYHLDVYLSFGFDNAYRRYRYDGWVYTLEITGQYSLFDYTYNRDIDNYRSIKLLRLGSRVGVAYVFDYYHHRGWHKYNKK